MFNQGMQRLQAIYRFELRLISFHWSYWLIQIVFAGVMLSSFITPTVNYETAGSLLMAGVGHNAIGLISLIVLFLAGHSAGRSQRHRYHQLQATFPTDIELPLGQILAVITASLPFLVVPLIMAWIAGPPESVWHSAPIFIFEGVLTIAFSTGVIWLIHTAIGIRRWMFPIFGFVWLAGSIASVGLNTNGLAIPGISLLNFARLGYASYTETWGRLLQGNLPFYLNLFYTGLVLLFVGLIVWVVRQRRFNSRHGWALFLIGPSLGLGVWGGSAYAITVANDNAQIRSELTYRSYLPDFLLPAAAPYVVKSYDIALYLDDEPHFEVQMSVLNRSDQSLTLLDFTLNAQFSVLESTTDYERIDDFLRIRLAQPLPSGETTTIKVLYTGRLRHLEAVPGTPAELKSFILPEGVNLAYTAGWYPIAGRVSLITGPQGRMPDTPAAIRLQVIAGDLHFASNLPEIAPNIFESTGAKWAQLIGAPDLGAEVILENITIVSSSREFKKTRERLERLFSTAYETASQYFHVPRIIVILPWVQGLQFPTMQDVAVMDEGLAFFLVPSQLQFPQGEYETGVYAITRAVLHDDDMTLLTDNIAYFLWIRIQGENEPARMNAVLEEKISRQPRMQNVDVTRASPGFALSYDITRELLDIYTEYGDAEAIRAIQGLQANFETLKSQPASEVVAWLEESIGDE